MVVDPSCKDSLPNPQSAIFNPERGCSSMAERQLPKLDTRVRFPSPAVVPAAMSLPQPKSSLSPLIAYSRGLGRAVLSRPIGSLIEQVQGQELDQEK